MRWLTPPNRRSMPSCLYPAFSTRSETPESTSIFTLPCSRMPARWVVRIVSWSRFSTTTLSIPDLGQQVGQHQPGGAAADDADSGRDHFGIGHSRLLIEFGSNGCDGTSGARCAGADRVNWSEWVSARWTGCGSGVAWLI